MAAITSEATSVWTGDLKSGSGSVTLDSSQAGAVTVTWRARSEGESGMSNPEELLAAAHASCFSMACASALTKYGASPRSLQVTAAVTFDPDEGITGSHLLLSAEASGISDDDFQRVAEEAKTSCPVSRALIGIPVTLEAELA